MKKMIESTDNRKPLKPAWHIAFVCALHELERTFRKLGENSKSANLFSTCHTKSDLFFLRVQVPYTPGDADKY
jgi:hypothetical protein